MTAKKPKTPKKPAPVAPDEVFARAGGSRPKKKLDGRPFAPTHQDRQMVMLMRVAGFTQESAARQLDWPFGIDPKTFRKHFSAEWEAAKERLHTLLLGTQIAIATDKAHPKVAVAGLFLLKSLYGYRDHDPRSATAEVTLPPGASPDMPLKFTLKIGEREDADG